MTSTNHFRGRKIGHSKPPPLSPRHYRRPVYPPPPPPPAVLLLGFVQIVRAGNTSKTTTTGLTFAKITTDIYRWTGLDDQGFSARIDVQRTAGLGLVTAQYACTISGGLAFECEADDFGYTPAVPYLGTPTAWYALTSGTVTGTMQISLPGGWPP